MYAKCSARVLFREEKIVFFFLSKQRQYERDTKLTVSSLTFARTLLRSFGILGRSDDQKCANACVRACLYTCNTIFLLLSMCMCKHVRLMLCCYIDVYYMLRLWAYIHIFCFSFSYVFAALITFD